MREPFIRKRNLLWLGCISACIVILLLFWISIPRTLSVQTKKTLPVQPKRTTSAHNNEKLKGIENAVDSLTRYLYENKELLAGIDRYHLSSGICDNVEGGRTIQKINGKSFQTVPPYSTITTLIDMEKFIQDHPVFEIPDWEENRLEMGISQYYAVAFNKPYTLDDLLMFSVHAQIVNYSDYDSMSAIEKHIYYDKPYDLFRDENDNYDPKSQRNLFDISNGLSSEGIIIKSSFDLSGPKHIDAPIVPYQMP